MSASERAAYATLVAVGIVVAVMTFASATQHDADGLPCEAVGVYTSASGTPVILRECPDGTFVHDYPYIPREE